MNSYNFPMESVSFVRLDLRSSIVYEKIQDLPPDDLKNAVNSQKELLFCYQLDPIQSISIEPKQDCLLGPCIFTGLKTDSDSDETVALPAGIYIFMQCRENCNQEQWLNMAIEQQKDSLWERYILENKLYVRFLFEDGKTVTQLFRPCAV